MTVTAQPRAGVDELLLLASARAGDADAFVALARLHEQGLWRLAFRLLGDRDGAADVLQETLVRAFRSLPSFRSDSSVGTWLYRIAYNMCLDELRRSRVALVPLAEADELQAAGGRLEDVAAARADLAVALGGLPVDERAALLLVDAEGRSYAEAAHVLGVPEGTVASRLNRARTALRTALADGYAEREGR